MGGIKDIPARDGVIKSSGGDKPYQCRGSGSDLFRRPGGGGWATTLLPGIQDKKDQWGG